MTFRILPAAQADLRHIDDWVASNFGEAAARRATAEIYDTFDLLIRYQEIGHLRLDVTSRPIRFFSLPPNIIAYTPGEPLVIHRVLPSRMDIARQRL